MSYQPELPWFEEEVADRHGRRAGVPARRRRTRGPRPAPRRDEPGSPAAESRSPDGVGDDWRLDEPTRRTGLSGLAEARAALARVADAHAA